MPKPKLSDDQRKALRKNIRTRLSKKELPAVIIKKISEKYKIASETARWYLKTTLVPGSASKNGKQKRKTTAMGNGHGARRAKPKARRRQNGSMVARRTSSNGSSLAQNAIRKGEDRMRQAKRLVPKLEAVLSKARVYRRQEVQIRRSARAAEVQGKKIQSRILKLTSP